MRALLSLEPGGPDTLRLTDVPDPAPGPGELLVRIRAAAVNFPDVLIIEDKYQFKPPRPFAPGGEISGEVEVVGEAVEGWKPGDRVIAVPGWGGFAEKIVIPAKSAIPLPEGRSFVEGAALLLPIAAWPLTLWAHGLYRPRVRLTIRGEALDVLRATMTFTAAILIALYFFKLDDFRKDDR